MADVKSYISSFSGDVQDILIGIRKIILNQVPDAEEEIAYGMPAYKYKGQPLIYYAAFKNHIGVYATPSAHQYFKDKLQSYKSGKGSVQFPLNKPIPYKLIEEMVVYKQNEIDQK
ncbi:iron chaperone [Aegicerativicinus sediminis]|uniref:iron chaperone n=1 Tax=Aegicerativicinus sediminis TaxID=2893202 RepID=UPI001E3C7BF0|nr:DUF1801 domain-containing protein [Aegicerativicinus sediminis]